MKKVWQILLIVLLVAVVAAAVLALRYRDYFSALSDAKQYSSEDLQQQIDDNEAALGEILAQYLPAQQPQEQSAEQKSVANETQTIQNAEDPSRITDPPTAPAQQEDVAEKLPDPEITELVATFYQLRDDYGAKLEDIKARAYDEYHRTNPGKSELAKMAVRYVREATLLEVECDKQVLSLLDQLSKHIKENGGDQTLPEKILELYLNEKRVKKAWYFSELEKRGLVL